MSRAMRTLGEPPLPQLYTLGQMERGSLEAGGRVSQGGGGRSEWKLLSARQGTNHHLVGTAQPHFCGAALLHLSAPEDMSGCKQPLFP